MHLQHALYENSSPPCVFLGKEILHLRDQSTYVGILLTTGKSSKTALLNALLEANKINLIIEK